MIVMVLGSIRIVTMPVNIKQGNLHHICTRISSLFKPLCSGCRQIATILHMDVLSTTKYWSRCILSFQYDTEIIRFIAWKNMFTKLWNTSAVDWVAVHHDNRSSSHFNKIHAMMSLDPLSRWYFCSGLSC